MLIQQLHYELKLELNKIDSNDRPDLLPAEIDAYLNRGIWRWFVSRYGSEKPKKGFETNQLRISNLASLHVKSPELQVAITPTSLGSGIYEVKLSSLTYDYFVLTRARTDITKSNCTHSKDTVKIVETDDDNTIRFLKPSFIWKRVNARFGKSSDGTANQSIYFDTGSDFTISSVYLDYIKKPNQVFLGTYDRTNIGLGSALTAVECDIDSNFHYEIVSMARQEIERDIYQDPKLTIRQTEFDKINP